MANEKYPLEAKCEKLVKELILLVKKFGDLVKKFGIFFLEVPLQALKGKKIKMDWWFVWITYIALGVFLLKCWSIR